METSPVWNASPDAALVLAEKVSALRSPACYPQPTATVTCIETHWSWVFLTDRHAFKLKKPLYSPPLDLRGLSQRLRCCEDEVRLNRRLAHSVYLDVIPLMRAGCGALHIGGEGNVVDYLVMMRRLPTERMLDRMLAARSLRRADVRAIAQTLANFYCDAERTGFQTESYRERMRQQVLRARRELIRAQYRLPRNLIERITAGQLRFIDNDAELAARGAHVIEAHGDLRPEHIYLGPPLQIIDCLEFDRDLRLLDSVDELAFLALECARLGAPRCGWRVLWLYQQMTGDKVSSRLVRFYQSRQACIRAHLAIWHWDDPRVRDRTLWHKRACDYLYFARDAIFSLEAASSRPPR